MEDRKAEATRRLLSDPGAKYQWTLHVVRQIGKIPVTETDKIEALLSENEEVEEDVIKEFRDNPEVRSGWRLHTEYFDKRSK